MIDEELAHRIMGAVMGDIQLYKLSMEAGNPIGPIQAIVEGYHRVVKEMAEQLEEEL
jgi:hypothetical protein